MVPGAPPGVALASRFGFRRVAHAAPRIVVLDLGYPVKGRPVRLVADLRSIGVLFWRMVRCLILRRKSHPRSSGVLLLRANRDSYQRNCRDCNDDGSHRPLPPTVGVTRCCKRYEMSCQKAIARAVGPARCRLSELYVDQKCTPRPTNPTQMLRLFLQAKAGLMAQPTLSFSDRTRLLLIRSYHWKPPLRYQPP